MNAETFNSLYPVGTPVFAYPGARPEDFPKSAKRLVTKTRSRASVLGGHTDVVWVDGHSACIALSHVDVVAEEQWEEARADCDAAASQHPPKEGSAEWLEQLPRDERWPHTEVLALYADTVVNPSYDVAIYHLRYAVAEVKRLTSQVADLEKDSATLAALEAAGVDNWEGYSDALAGVDE